VTTCSDSIAASVWEPCSISTSARAASRVSGDSEFAGQAGPGVGKDFPNGRRGAQVAPFFYSALKGCIVSGLLPTQRVDYGTWTAFAARVSCFLRADETQAWAGRRAVAVMLSAVPFRQSRASHA
jgi:hypothetical protein